MFANRPNSRETDDDIIRMHEEFVRDKEAANQAKSTAATRYSQGGDDINSKNKANSSYINNNAIADQLVANTFEAIPSSESIGRIVERASVGHDDVDRVANAWKFSRTNGFPAAKRRDPTGDGASNKKSKRSIFSQQMNKFNNKSNADNDASSEPMELDQEKPQVPDRRDQNKDDEINEENIRKINSMSESEIMEERQQLLSTMDPAIVAFLKARRRKQERLPVSGTTRNRTIREQNEAADDPNNIAIAEIMMQPNADKWLNFNTLETNKLAWMADVCDMPVIDKAKPFEARFDFDGWLRSYVESTISEQSRVLYHHGEDANRPGYTLQELFQLSRSDVAQQRIIALNTIANILSLVSTGVYDHIITIPIEQTFFVLRFCLDDNIPAVLNASIKAMRALICSQIDETCLDLLGNFGGVGGLVQPLLAVDTLPDDNTVNDQQLVETNLIKCLARTDILIRIRYIMTTVKPAIETIVYCLDILTRLVRDSEYILYKVYKCDGLIECIITNYLPIKSESPLLQAVKFFRILATRSKTIAKNLIEKYNIMDSIIYYLSSEKYSLNVNGLRLQAASFNFWSTLIHYNLGLDYFQILTPVLSQILNYHYKNTDLIQTTYTRQSHVGALLNLISTISGLINNNEVSLIVAQSFSDLLKQCTSKWCAQFMDLDNFLCGKLQIISSLLVCISSCCQNINVIGMNWHSIDEIVMKLVQSKGFTMVTESIKNGSMLLNNYEIHRSSTNLRTVEAAAWHTSEHTVPIIQSNSCIPFLNALSTYIERTENYNLKVAFLCHPNMTNYFVCLQQQSDKCYLTNNWFTRIESNLIMNVLKTAISVQNHLNNTAMFYEITVKCLSVFNHDQKRDIAFLLRKIIFSSQFYCYHSDEIVLLNNLRINNDDDDNDDSLRSIINDHLDDILQVYTDVLDLKVEIPNDDFALNLSLDISLGGNVVPVDWIYTPIIVLYSNQQQEQQLKNNTRNNSRDIFLITNCLRWIFIYETHFPLLATAINPTDRFCRLACVFLGSDNLFLDKNIHNLLALCLKNMLSNDVNNDFHFDQKIQGLNNFQDFYTQLLEQYQAVSYGDVLFGNFILIPLAQQHNVQWRKMLWSEHVGVVECFNVTGDQMFSKIESFLNPPETDLSLLKCYRRALAGNLVRRHSILYDIAKYHVEQFAVVKRKKSTK